MKLTNQIIAAGIICAATVVSAAGQAAGGSSMLCALTNTVSCDSDQECLKGPATAVNLPVFMLFHPDKKVVESAKQGGERRTSSIASVVGQGDFLVLLGSEETTGWSVRINKASGGLTGSIVTEDAGYLIFGSCIPH